MCYINYSGWNKECESVLSFAAGLFFLLIFVAGWPLVMEIMEIMQKSWNFFWSWKKSWNFKNLPNSHGKVIEVIVMEVFYKDHSFF